MNLPLIANVGWKRRQLRRHDRWTPQQLEAHQTRALHLLREYAYARSPFYQQFHQGLIKTELRGAAALRLKNSKGK